LAEPNPYASPKNHSDAFEIAVIIRLLDARENGYSLRRHYGKMAKTYVLLTVVMMIPIAYFSWFNFAPMAYIMLGVYFGALLRDFGLARVQVRMWPIQTKLINWEKVERMAAGQAIEAK
jgi:hypothetical protein